MFLQRCQNSIATLKAKPVLLNTGERLLGVHGIWGLLGWNMRLSAHPEAFILPWGMGPRCSLIAAVASRSCQFSYSRTTKKKSACAAYNWTFLLEDVGNTWKPKCSCMRHYAVPYSVCFTWKILGFEAVFFTAVGVFVFLLSDRYWRWRLRFSGRNGNHFFFKHVFPSVYWRGQEERGNFALFWVKNSSWQGSESNFGLDSMMK